MVLINEDAPSPTMANDKVLLNIPGYCLVIDEGSRIQVWTQEGRWQVVQEGGVPAVYGSRLLAEMRLRLIKERRGEAQLYECRIGPPFVLHTSIPARIRQAWKALTI